METVTKVCSFNLRVQKAKDGINAFFFRRPLVKAVLRREAFDVIGFQECVPWMCRFLTRTLRGYTVLYLKKGVSRMTGQVPVAFRNDKFRLLSFEAFWLSDTPDVPNSRFPTDQSKNPRLCFAVSLEEKETGKRLRVYNTHLDHKGETARKQGMDVILNRLQTDAPLLLMGDFNASPHSPFLKTIPFADATATLPVTFTAFHPEQKGSKIDYIYTNAPFSSPRVLTDRKGKRMLSDHYPVAIDITL